MKEYDAFISYSNNDEQIVKPVAQLVGAGRHVFFDKRNIVPGDYWEKRLKAALKNSKILVILWCCHSANSDWVSKETEIARNWNKPIIPFLLCSFPTSPNVSEYQWIDGRDMVRHNCSSSIHDALESFFIRTSKKELLSAVSSEFNIESTHPDDINDAYIKWQKDKSCKNYQERLKRRNVTRSLGLIGAIILLLVLNKPFPSPFDATITNLINICAAVAGSSFCILYIGRLYLNRRKYRSLPVTSQLLALSIETVFRLVDRGQLGRLARI